MGTLWPSDVVVILSCHKWEALNLQHPWSRLGVGWMLGNEGTHNVPLPLVLCDLVHSIVLVCPGIKLLNLSVLQFPLECMILSSNGLEFLEDILSACCSCLWAWIFKSSQHNRQARDICMLLDWVSLSSGQCSCSLWLHDCLPSPQAPLCIVHKPLLPFWVPEYWKLHMLPGGTAASQLWGSSLPLQGDRLSC